MKQLATPTPTLFTTAQGQFKLKRYPISSKGLLQAWDAADEYCLNYLVEDLKPTKNTQILVINDGFGALTVALQAFQPTSISDSYLAQQATLANMLANKQDQHSIQLLNSLEFPEASFDFILIKLPKTLALLEDQLIRLRPQLRPTTKIITAGMSKYMPTSVWTLLQRLIGPTFTPPTKKKAKLIITTFDSKLNTPTNPYPKFYQLENSEYQLCNHANVFSRESLDIGTRFLLAHLPIKKNLQDLVDLGCGNGIVGLMLANTHPSAKIYFVDESYMAIASAKTNFTHAFPERKNVIFKVTDALASFAPASVDLIICNPPFHQQNSINDQTAKHMLQQSKTVLRKGGELWVIGNRHLGYHQVLKKIFTKVSIEASNRKFVIIKGYD